MAEKRRRGVSNLGGKIGEAVDIPRTSIVNAAHIELLENREAIIEGCRCVAEYNDTAIKLNMGKKLVRFTGCGLTIKTLRPEQVVICGEILSIDFCN